jgi:hypothetical protein
MNDQISRKWDEFEPGVDPQTWISENFRFYELTRSNLAARQSIDNSFSSVTELRSAVYLCRNIIQPIREEFGQLTPNSVFRSQALERALKKKGPDWTSSSQHTQGQACDLEIIGVPTLEFAQWVSNNLTFDQLICECYNPDKGPNSGWVHISLVPPGYGDNRQNELSYIYSGDEQRYVYVEGLRSSTFV